MMELTKARVNGCLSEKRYPSEEYAKMVGRIEQEKRGVRLRVYRCQFGYHFHLTKRPKGFVNNRNKKNCRKLYL